MQFSHSRVDCFEKCKFKYKLQYIDRIKTIPLTNPDNSLYLGHALHTGIEQSVADALDDYYSYYPIITDEIVNEAMKLEYWIPKVREILPPGGEFEVELKDHDFIGYIDYLVPIGENLYDLYDFKYSNNIADYKESSQLHLYKYFFERDNPGKKIRDMYFIFIPKIRIRQKKDEELMDFRERIESELSKSEIRKERIEFDYEKIVEWIMGIKAIFEEKDFNPCIGHLCRYCDYQEYCEKGWSYIMQLPENKRRNIEEVHKRVIWIYGAPFCGKTTFANEFPDPLMLNTDGNIKFVDAPYIRIRDEVWVEGRQTKRKLAWEVFKEAIDELEKKDNDFKTIVVDLLEDLYEHCRLYMYQQMGITHESDDSFRAWDKVRTEFLSTLRRLMNLDYENIILISHEDTSKDITKKGGDKVTAIKPAIQDKVANKVAGMVDLVARIVADGDVRTLSFKSNEVIFGGGRLKVSAKDIPLDVDALFAVYDEANRNAKDTIKKSSGSRSRKSASKDTALEAPKDFIDIQDENQDAGDPNRVVGDPAVAEKDSYFYVPADDNYIMKHKGDIIPFGAEEISKEDFDKGCIRISQESMKNAMNPPEAPAESEAPKQRRRRKARAEDNG